MARNRKVFYKLVAAGLMTVLVLVTLAPAGMGAGTEVIKAARDKAIDYYYKLEQAPDWKYALALAAAGDAGAGDYQIRKPDLSKMTEVENRIIGLTAAGLDPTRALIGGERYNLVQMLVDSQNSNGQFATGDTLNATIWGVIALEVAKNNGVNGCNYDLEKAADYISFQQQTDGSFDESGWGADADSTAHALIALALTDQVAKTDDVVVKALEYLHSQQLDSGGINNWGDNPASTAAVIEALMIWGEDPQGPAWTKNGNTLVDRLLSYQVASGGFIQDSTWGPVDHTPFALLALADLAAGSSKYKRAWDVETRDLRVDLQKASLKAGTDADIELQVTNTAGSNKSGLLIAALYDAQGRMTNYSYLQRTFTPGVPETVGLGFALPADSGYKVKILTWESWESCRPLSNLIVIPVE